MSTNSILFGRASVMASALQLLVDGAINARQSAREAREKRQLADQLSALSDRELDDIGLSRADFPRSHWDESGIVSRLIRLP